MTQVATKSVIVFGASDSGRRALQKIRGDEACEVIAFADNSPRLQGTAFEGLPVITPAPAALDAVDAIVVASHRWPEIVAQLHEYGIGPERIEIYPIEASQMVSGSGPEPSSPPDARLAALMADRIHYACGQRVLDGWLNVDGFDESYPNGCVDLDQRRRIYRMNLAAPHPFPDDSFQWGYSEDFLEHLTQAESLVFLSEAYRTLRPGGVLRLSFPGLAGVLRRHLRSGGAAGAAACVEEAYTRWYHRHFYTFESLELVARHIGFSRVTRYDYGHSGHRVLLQDSRFNQADLNVVAELTK